MYLNKEQYNFLKRVSHFTEIDCNSFSTQELNISKYLESKHLVYISRESFPKITNGQVSYRYGKMLSVKITEQGKSYIAERNYELKKLLFKDVVIPIMVSIITTLIINSLKLL